MYRIVINKNTIMKFYTLVKDKEAKVVNPKIEIEKAKEIAEVIIKEQKEKKIKEEERAEKAKKIIQKTYE